MQKRLVCGRVGVIALWLVIGGVAGVSVVAAQAAGSAKPPIPGGDSLGQIQIPPDGKLGPVIKQPPAIDKTVQKKLEEEVRKARR